MIHMPPQYCSHCEERLATVKWFPFCDQTCTKFAIKSGWKKLK